MPRKRHSKCITLRCKNAGPYSRDLGLCRACGRDRKGGSVEDKVSAGSAGGKRSGLRRKTEMALVIKKFWLDKILARKKVWEIRSSSTKRRGWIHLAESKSGNIVGGANLVDCFQIKRSEFCKYRQRHCVQKLKDIKYKNIWAWVVKGAKKYSKPFPYYHTAGAVIFVRVRQPMGPQSK